MKAPLPPTELLMTIVMIGFLVFAAIVIYGIVTVYI
jgi:hypothetical protein